MDFNIKMSCAESDEEDYGSYFLEPSQTPYVMAERVQQANIDLSNTDIKSCKTIKVQFKENLVTYEPELTDEDVNSIESDTVEIKMEELVCEEYRTVTSLCEESLKLFDIREADEDAHENIEEEIEDETAVEEKLESASVKDTVDSNQPIKHKTHKKYRKPTRSKSANIECKSHCIDKLGYDLSMYIKKLEIHSKPQSCPPLKLHQRKCCNGKQYYNLPTYNGLRSEYGLTMEQLEEKKRRKNSIHQRKRKPRLKNDERSEAFFSEWLKGIARRKTKEEVYKCNTKPHNYKDNFFVFPQSASKYKNAQVCVYIELPNCKLNKHMHIGNLLIGKK